MKGTAWSHLPNAVHIDRVLASVKSHPKSWIASFHADRNTARMLARSASEDKGRGEAWYAAWDAAWDATRNAGWPAAPGADAGDAALSVISALVAWDDCAPYLDMPSEQLKMWYHLTERPACLLLLPAVRAFEQIEEMEMA